MKYQTSKKIREVKDKIINILLFPVRCIYTPIYILLQKLQKNKKYSEKQITKIIQYLIDYWLDEELNEEFYVIIDDSYNPFDYHHVSTPFHMMCDMSWGWRGENKKAKNKATYIHYYQKEQYLDIFKKLCGKPMTLEEKNKYFDEFDVCKIKDRAIYKIK